MGAGGGEGMLDITNPELFFFPEDYVVWETGDLDSNPKLIWLFFLLLLFFLKSLIFLLSLVPIGTYQLLVRRAIQGTLKSCNNVTLS